jgi:tRNA/tmRNA/rRNA uracil-C5-methylase (TrmA/RlmC/RlmD family)
MEECNYSSIIPLRRSQYGLKKIKKNWNELGKADSFWSILTAPDKKGNKWEINDFFQPGQREIDTLIKYIQTLVINFKQGKALNFGCGVGRLTQALAEHFQQGSRYCTLYDRACESI